MNSFSRLTTNTFMFFYVRNVFMILGELIFKSYLHVLYVLVGPLCSFHMGLIGNLQYTCNVCCTGVVCTVALQYILTGGFSCKRPVRSAAPASSNVQFETHWERRVVENWPFTVICISQVCYQDLSGLLFNRPCQFKNDSTPSAESRII